MPWADLFEPAIRLCEEGYTVSKALAVALKDKEQLIKNNTALTEMYVNPATNSVYQQGDVIKRIRFASTLRILAEQGHTAFYDGVLTPLIVDEINKNGQ